MKKNKILFVIIFLISNFMYSQTSFGDNVEDVTPEGAPIDGWVLWALLGASIYGFKTVIMDRTKKTEKQEG